MTAGYYVYSLADPFDGSTFYIGKGKGLRYQAHLIEHRKFHRWSNQAKHQKIAEILERGDTVLCTILFDGLTEAAALQLERQMIATNRHTITNGNNRLPPAVPIAVRARQQLAAMVPYPVWAQTHHAQKPLADYVYRLVRASLELFAYGKPIPAELYP